MQGPSEGEEGEGDNEMSAVTALWRSGWCWFGLSTRFNSCEALSSTLLFGSAEGWVPEAVVSLRLYGRYESSLRLLVVFPFSRADDLPRLLWREDWVGDRRIRAFRNVFETQDKRISIMFKTVKR